MSECESSIQSNAVCRKMTCVLVGVEKVGWLSLLAQVLDMVCVERGEVVMKSTLIFSSIAAFGSSCWDHKAPRH